MTSGSLYVREAWGKVKPSSVGTGADGRSSGLLKDKSLLPDIVVVGGQKEGTSSKSGGPFIVSKVNPVTSRDFI